jgi:hypothetical protein
MKKTLFAVLLTALVLSFGSCTSQAKAVEEPAPVEVEEAVDAAE